LRFVARHVQSQIPPNSGPAVSVERVEITKFADRDALEYVAIIYSPPVGMCDTTMLLVHRQRVHR
jgi:hypothetical protein